MLKQLIRHQAEGSAATGPTPETKSNTKPFLIIIAFLSIALATMAVIHFRPSHPQDNATMLAANPAPPAPPPATPAPSPPETPAPHIETKPIAQQVAQARPAPPPVDTNALADAALQARILREQQEQEQQRINLRQQALVQIKATLDEQASLLTKFKTNCEATLDDNTNKIARLSYSNRKSLGKVNQELRDSLADMTMNEDDFLKKTASVVEGYVADVKSNPQPLIRQLAVQLTRIENDRQSFMDNCNLLTTNIATAPKRGGFSLFK